MTFYLKMEIVFDFKKIIDSLIFAERKPNNDLSRALGNCFWIFEEEQHNDSTGNHRR